MWYELAMFQGRQENYEASAEALDKALEVQSDHLPSLMAKTKLLEQNQSFEEALDSARNIQAKHPSNSIGYNLEGDLHMVQQNYTQAAAAYQAAYDKSASGGFVLKLSNAQRLAGDEEAALQSLRNWLDIEPRDNRVRTRLALYLHQMNRRAEAIAEYERILEQLPSNWFVLNNLAWLYHEAGDTRAVDYAERAYALAPNNPDVADTLGWFLVQNEQAQRGLTLLRQAVDKTPQSLSTRYHLAVAYDKTGSKERAREELEALLANDNDFPERDAAESLLTRLKEIK